MMDFGDDICGGFNFTGRAPAGVLDRVAGLRLPLCPHKRYPAQSFRISLGIVERVNSDINAYLFTFGDMAELNLDASPYDSFTIEVPIRFTVADGDIEYGRYTPGIGAIAFHFHPDGLWLERRMGPKPETWAEMGWNEHRAYLASVYRAVLCVLLATPNVVKTREKDKLLCLGIGKGRGAKYTTSLSIGKVEYEDDGISVPGVEPRDVRPHLRRGHIRNQVCGEGRAERKRIFVPPCFVNGDPSFHPKRDHYEVRLATRA